MDQSILDHVAAWIRTLEHSVGLFAVPSVPHACLLKRWKVGDFFAHGLDGSRLIVVADVEGGNDGLALDAGDTFVASRMTPLQVRYLFIIGAMSANAAVM
jgi:hypothetical protein